MADRGEPDDYVACPECDGTDRRGKDPDVMLCDYCGGSGEVPLWIDGDATDPGPDAVGEQD